jgi:hypothetical protein
VITKHRPANDKGTMGYRHPGGIKKLDELDLAEQDVLRCQSAVEQNGRKRAFFTEYRDRPVVGYRRLVNLYEQIAKLEQQIENEHNKLDMADHMVKTCNALDSKLVADLDQAITKRDGIIAKRRAEQAKEIRLRRGKVVRERRVSIPTDVSSKLAAAGISQEQLLALLAKA